MWRGNIYLRFHSDRARFDRQNHSRFTVEHIYITTDPIVTLLAIPPDIYTEPALPVWLPGGSTKYFFCKVAYDRFTFAIFMC